MILASFVSETCDVSETQSTWTWCAPTSSQTQRGSLSTRYRWDRRKRKLWAFPRANQCSPGRPSAGQLSRSSWGNKRPASSPVLITACTLVHYTALGRRRFSPGFLLVFFRNRGRRKGMWKPGESTNWIKRRRRLGSWWRVVVRILK